MKTLMRVLLLIFVKLRMKIVSVFLSAIFCVHFKNIGLNIFSAFLLSVIYCVSGIFHSIFLTVIRVYCKKCIHFVKWTFKLQEMYSLCKVDIQANAICWKYLDAWLFFHFCLKFFRCLLSAIFCVNFKSSNWRAFFFLL